MSYASPGFASPVKVPSYLLRSNVTGRRHRLEMTPPQASAGAVPAGTISVRRAPPLGLFWATSVAGDSPGACHGRRPPHPRAGSRPSDPARRTTAQCSVHPDSTGRQHYDHKEILRHPIVLCFGDHFKPYPRKWNMRLPEIELLRP